jgi:hypothetical protein
MVTRYDETHSRFAMEGARTAADVRGRSASEGRRYGEAAGFRAQD